MHSRLVRLAALVAVSLLATAPAMAQEAESSAPSGLGFGLKAGAGNDPAQVVIGAQWALHRKWLRLFRLVPNVHLGLGDYTTTDFNVDLIFRLPTAKGFALYGGGAPTVTLSSEGDTDMGGTWVLGAQIPVLKSRATNLEMRFGGGGAAKFRLMATLVL